MSMIELTFLGTSSMFPTKKRSQSAIHIKLGSNNLLFDCGEGTQRQLRIAGISPMKIDNIFVTHWHGDHALGIAGLIQSMSAARRKKDLYIYGPVGTSTRVYHIIKSFLFDLTFKVKAVELKIKDKTIQKVFENEEFEIESMPVRHIVPCLAYNFIEKGKRRINLDYVKEKMGVTRHRLLGKLQKGEDIEWKGKKITAKKATYNTPNKKVTYIVDTSYFKELVKMAKDADLFICEATYVEDMGEKADRYSHLTAKKAAKLAEDAKVDKLYLTHFSQRYASLKAFKEEAKQIFKNIKLARDFDRVEIK